LATCDPHFIVVCFPFSSASVRVRVAGSIALTRAVAVNVSTTVVLVVEVATAVVCPPGTVLEQAEKRRERAGREARITSGSCFVFIGFGVFRSLDYAITTRSNMGPWS
jgi:hypothetical protein